MFTYTVTIANKQLKENNLLIIRNRLKDFAQENKILEIR
jgi:hypothetical protein